MKRITFGKSQRTLADHHAKQFSRALALNGAEHTVTDLSHIYHRPGELFWRENDPFQDAVPCFIMNNSDRWDGWGERSRWEPDYKNDDERQDARRRNRYNREYL